MKGIKVTETDVSDLPATGDVELLKLVTIERASSPPIQVLVGETRSGERRYLGLPKGLSSTDSPSRIWENCYAKPKFLAHLHFTL